MNKYLNELLNEENTIIIPNFGALTVVNRARREFMFMPYLKFDDGQLSKFIIEKEGWTLLEAQDLIGKYVHEIKITLEKGGSYSFPDIGTFKTSKDGDVEFVNWEENNSYTTPKADIIPVSTTVEKEIITSDIDLEVSITESVEEVIEEVIEEIIEIPETVIESTQKIEPIIEVVQQEEPITLEEVSVTEFVHENTTTVTEEMAPEEQQWKDDLDIPPLNYTPPLKKKPILEKIEKDKKPAKRRPVLKLIAILILLVSIGGIGFYWEQVKKIFVVTESAYLEDEVEKGDRDSIPAPEMNEAEESTSEIIQEIEKEEKMIATEPTQKVVEVEVNEVKSLKTEKIQSPTVSTNTSTASVNKTKPYQAIAGSFGEEANANKMVVILKGKGFDSAVVGVRNGMHLVSIGSYDSEAEYQSKKAQLNTAGPHWLMHQK